MGTESYIISYTSFQKMKPIETALYELYLDFLNKNTNKSESTKQEYAERIAKVQNRKLKKKSGNELKIAEPDYYTTVNTLFPELLVTPFVPPEKPSFTFVDLFSGIGGFHQAMHQLNGKCLLASEIDGFAIDTYLDNYGINSNQDVRDIKDEDFPIGKRTSVKKTAICIKSQLTIILKNLILFL